MSKSIIDRINRAVAFHRQLRGRGMEYWRNKENPVELRKEAALMTLRSNYVLSKLLHYRQQFTRPTLPKSLCRYQVEFGLAISKIDRRIVKWER